MFSPLPFFGCADTGLSEEIMAFTRTDDFNKPLEIQQSDSSSPSPNYRDTALVVTLIYSTLLPSLPQTSSRVTRSRINSPPSRTLSARELR